MPSMLNTRKNKSRIGYRQTIVPVEERLMSRYDMRYLDAHTVVRDVRAQLEMPDDITVTSTLVRECDKAVTGKQQQENKNDISKDESNMKSRSIDMDGPIRNKTSTAATYKVDEMVIKTLTLTTEPASPVTGEDQNRDLEFAMENVWNVLDSESTTPVKNNNNNYSSKGIGPTGSFDDEHTTATETDSFFVASPETSVSSQKKCISMTETFCDSMTVPSYYNSTSIGNNDNKQEFPKDDLLLMPSPEKSVCINNSLKPRMSENTVDVGTSTSTADMSSLTMANNSITTTDAVIVMPTNEQQQQDEEEEEESHSPESLASIPPRGRKSTRGFSGTFQNMSSSAVFSLVTLDLEEEEQEESANNSSRDSSRSDKGVQTVDSFEPFLTSTSNHKSTIEEEDDDESVASSASSSSSSSSSSDGSSISDERLNSIILGTSNNVDSSNNNNNTTITNYSSVQPIDQETFKSYVQQTQPQRDSRFGSIIYRPDSVNKNQLIIPQFDMYNERSIVSTDNHSNNNTNTTSTAAPTNEVVYGIVTAGVSTDAQLEDGNTGTIVSTSVYGVKSTTTANDTDGDLFSKLVEEPTESTVDTETIMIQQTTVYTETYDEDVEGEHDHDHAEHKKSKKGPLRRLMRKLHCKKDQKQSAQ